MALEKTIERIKSNAANIGSIMMTGKTIEERVEELLSKQEDKNESFKCIEILYNLRHHRQAR